MSKSKPHYAWRLPSGGWWCKKPDGIHNTKIPSTPYGNRAILFPSEQSAEFMKPKVDFPLTLCKITFEVEEVAVYEPRKA